MIWLRQNTASQNIVIGPMLAFSDLKTPQTALTINNTDIRIHKAGASSFTTKNSGGATHLFGGYYLATLDATDTNTLGRMVIATNLSGVMSWSVQAVVLPADVFDALIDNTGRIRADVTHWSGTAVASANVRANVVQVAGQTASAAAGVTFPSSIGTSTLDASGVWSAATRTLTSLSGLTVDTVTNLTNAPSDSAGVTTLLSRVTSLRAGYLDNLSGGAVALAGTSPSWYTSPPSAATITSSVWASATRTLTSISDSSGVATLLSRDTAADALEGTAPTWYSSPLDPAGVRSAIGLASANLDTQLDDIPTVSEFNARTIASANYATSTNLATVDAVVDAIKLKTDNLPTDPASQTTTGAAITSATSPLATASALAVVDAVVDAIQADTEDIQARLPAALVGGRMDVSVGSMASNTVTASAVAADAVAKIQAGLSTLDASSVRTAIGMASANFDTQIGDIPTVSEFNARTISSADYATSSALAVVDATVDAILVDTDTTIPSLIDALPTAAENAAALLDLTDGVEVGLTPRQAMRLFAAALGGVLSGAGTTTITIKGAGVSTNRIVATVDTNENRTAVTLNLS